MKPNIEYSVDIIVGILLNGNWKWYVTKKEIWILDQAKLEEQFQELGYKGSNICEVERKNIPVLDETTVSVFLPRIEKFLVNSNELQDILNEKLPVSRWDEISELFPSLLVNFDNLELWSIFPELTSFEKYVPEGWIGQYENFYELIPLSERYWIIDGHDYFKELTKPE